jgi:sterol desaturase/sphingolipid hydroxylase (fatty acid hydroxylase superfamily)
VLALLAAVAIIDFAAYWRHRFEHSRALWRIHATHHADEAMNWFSLRRKHPLGELLSMAVDVLPALLLGLPVWAIIGALMVRSWWGYFIHADVPWTLGPVGKVLISPAAHRLHHIRDENLMGANYGNTITLWDHLFGTYTDPAPYVNCETGIAEGTRDFAGELLRPFEARYWKAKPDAAAEPAE